MEQNEKEEFIINDTNPPSKVYDCNGCQESFSLYGKERPQTYKCYCGARTTIGVGK